MDIDGNRMKSMDIHGHPRISMDIFGFPWLSIDIHGHQTKYMEIHRFLCIPMDICGYPKISADFHGYPWTCVDIMENVWAAGGRQAAGPSPPDPASMADNLERGFLHVAIYRKKQTAYLRVSSSIDGYIGCRM